MLPVARCLTAALLLLPACAAREDTTIDRAYDPCALVVVPAADLDAAEVSAIEEALHMWHSAADTRITLDDGTVADDVTLRLEVRFAVAPAAFRGVYDDERGIVFINRDLRDARVRSITVAHELGHSFGLTHVEPSERVSLMNPDNVDVAPNAGDAQAVRALWGRCSDR